MVNLNILQKIIILFSLISFISSSLIATNLWTKELLGKPHSARFINEKEYLMTTNKGVITKINSLTGEIIWKKTSVYNVEYEVDNVGLYSILVNKQNRFLDVINSQTSQLIWSLNFNTKKEEKILKWELINNGKNFIGILIQTHNLKIFNNERVIFEVNSKNNEEFLDLMVDPNNKNLLFVSQIGNTKLDINEIKLDNSQPQISLVRTQEINKEIQIQKGLLTNKFCFLLLNDESYQFFNFVESKSNFQFGTLTDVYGDFEVVKFKYLNKIAILSLTKKLENNINVITLEKNTIELIPLQKVREEEFYWDINETKNYSSLLILKKRNSNMYTILEFDLNSSEAITNEISKHQINEFFDVEQFIINHNSDLSMFVIISKEHKLYVLNKEKNLPLSEVDSLLSDPQYIDLLSYYKEQGEEKGEHYHINLESFIKKGQLVTLLENTCYFLLNDMREIYSRIFANVKGLIKNQNNNEENNDEKHHFIVYSRVNEELQIINAVTGKLEILRHLHGKQLYKIIKKDKQFAYIIIKDKTTNLMHSYKFDLENTKLRDDIIVINDFLLEEEIKNQSEALANSSNSSTVTISEKFPKSILQEYHNKYTVETNLSTNTIYGIKFQNSNGKLELSIAWNLILNQPIIPIQQIFPNVHSNLITTYHAMGKVFYKYIDSNIVLLLSSIENKTLLISLLNVKNGKILHQNYINNVYFSEKIIPIFEENMVVISYTKRDKSVFRNEIFALEIMKREIEHSFLHLLEKIFKFNLSGDYDHNNERTEETDLVFLSQTFVTPRRVKGMYVSKTKMNVGNKFIVFVLENNQVFLLDKRAISPRRPLMKEEPGKQGTPTLDPLNSPYIDPELAPYAPIILLDPKQVLNLHFQHDQINNIIITPTQFESTFIICTEGLNMSCYTVFPDKTFDTLTFSFSYSLIAIFIVGLITITYLLRRYVKKNEFRTTFLNS